MDGGPVTSARTEPRQAVHPLSIGEAGGGSQAASGRWTPGPLMKRSLVAPVFSDWRPLEIQTVIHEVPMGATCSFMACGNNSKVEGKLKHSLRTHPRIPQKSSTCHAASRGSWRTRTG